MSILDTLITDRVEADVQLVQRLNAVGIAGMTPAELTAYLAGLKGAYNAADLNRVTGAVAYVAAELTTAGYELPVLVLKTDWTDDDVPTVAQLAAYLENVRGLREILELAEGTPPAPADMVGLTWEEANAIEEIILAIDASLQLIIVGYIYADEMYSAEAWE